MPKRILPDRPLTRCEISERYRKRHPQRARSASARWRANNLENARERGRQYVRDKWRNDPEWREKIRLRKRTAYNNNPEHKEARKRSNSKWNKSEKGRHYARNYEHRHRRLDRGWLKFEDWTSILYSQNWKCAICNIEFSDQIKPQRDHIFPRRHGGTLIKENVQALCRPCNTRKGANLCLNSGQQK